MNMRLDRLIDELFNYSADKCRDRPNVLARDPYSHRETQYRSLHESAKAIPRDDLTRHGLGLWTVESQHTAGKIYWVKLKEERCPQPRCLKCRDCGVCRHMVTCTCERAKRDDLCRHIHACCTYFSDVVRSQFPIPQRNEGILEELVQTTAIVLADKVPLDDLLEKMMLESIDELREIEPAAKRKVVLDFVAKTYDVVNSSPSTAATTPTSTPQRRFPPANERMTPQRARYQGTPRNIMRGQLP